MGGICPQHEYEPVQKQSKPLTRPKKTLIQHPTPCEKEVVECKQLIADGVQDVFCPVCSLPDGEYEAMWSHPLSRIVFCRDPVTGKAIPGTRRNIDSSEPKWWEKQRQHCIETRERLRNEKTQEIQKQESTSHE